MTFKSTKENGGVPDPNINTKPIKRDKPTTKRAARDKEFMAILRKIKPHLSDSISTAARIMRDEKASEAGRLRAAVILLNAYKELVGDIYDGKEEEDDANVQEVQPQGAVVSFKVVK